MLDNNISQNGAVTTITTEGGFNVLLTSDVHFDSAMSNRKQFFKDLDVAVKNNMGIIIVGDFFDAMNGRFDPRRDMSALRPEYRRSDYYDYIVKDAADQLSFYAPNILMITTGNHEESVLKNANTDLIGRLTDRLSSASHTVYRGGYGGIILLRDGQSITPIKYFHGSGGEAPVTRGAIQTNRQAVFLPDFQVVLNGHSHHAYWIPIERERVTVSGEHYFDIQHHVRTPGYQMSYADGSSGWEVTRGGVPKPVGSFLLQFVGGEVIPTPLIHASKPLSAVADIYNGIIFPQE
jgi:hypothetical protein